MESLHRRPSPAFPVASGDIRMKNHLKLKLISAALVAALLASPLMAQTDSTSATGKESTRLSGEFSTFAGSDANSQALVDGLRSGTAITLTDSTTATTSTFQPDTGKLGYGNVKIALSLAEATLAKAGITDPTAAELEAALNGGTLVLADGTSIDLQGVLALRASGQGWGQIAKSLGFKLGDVMRSPKAAGSLAADGHAHGKVDRVNFDHGKAADHAGKPDVAGKSDVAGKPDMAGKPDVAGKMDRPDMPSRPDVPSRPEHPSHPDVPSHAGRPGG
jgi:hypothetical protein